MDRLTAPLSPRERMQAALEQMAARMGPFALAGGSGQRGARAAGWTAGAPMEGALPRLPAIETAERIRASEAAVLQPPVTFTARAATPRSLPEREAAAPTVRQTGALIREAGNGAPARRTATAAQTAGGPAGSIRNLAAPEISGAAAAAALLPGARQRQPTPAGNPDAAAQTRAAAAAGPAPFPGTFPVQRTQRAARQDGVLPRTAPAAGRTATPPSPAFPRIRLADAREAAQTQPRARTLPEAAQTQAAPQRATEQAVGAALPPLAPKRGENAQENRVVNLSPHLTVNATVTKEADLNELVRRIEQLLENEFAEAVEGVYG